MRPGNRRARGRDFYFAAAVCAGDFCLRLAAVVLIACAVRGHAQNLTTVTATKIQDHTGALLASGSLCFQATDNRDIEISYHVGGGGQAVRTKVCTAVANGAIGSFTVANPANTTPSGIYYRVTVTSSAAGAGTNLLLYRLVTFSGATFSFDTYVPTGVGIPPSAADTVMFKSPAGSQTWTQGAGTTGTFAGAGTFDFSAATLNLPIAKITPPSPCTTNYFIRWTGATYDCAAGGSGTPGGSANEVQVNIGGLFASDSNFAFFPTTLSTPGAPTVTNIGTAGSTTRRYAIVARNAVGGTVLGSIGTTTTGNATLTGSNYNHLAWTAVTGAATYDVWLTTAGGNTPTTGFLATVSTNSYDHQGRDGDGGDTTILYANTRGIYSGYALTIGPSPWSQPYTQVASWAQAARNNITYITSNAFENAVNINYSNTSSAGASASALTVSGYMNGTGVENNVGITSNVYSDPGSGNTTNDVSAFIGTVGILSGNVSPYIEGFRLTLANLGSGTVANAWGTHVMAPTNNGGGAITSNVAYYADDQCGVAGIANSYFLWHDSRGVYRIKCDNTFDSVYQSIPALYNPQFTKYTAGAADYERIVEQWNGNVAELGAEKGGTGTLRPLRLIGASLSARMNNRTAAFDLSNITNAATRTVNIPDATSTTVQAEAGSANNFLTAMSAQGVFSKARPACSSLSDAAASCATDTTVASNISSGTLPAARLPNPSASTLGGVQSKAAVSNEFLTAISTSGVPSSAQPAFSNLSGSATCAQLPALSGNVTTVAGNCATTIGASVVTNAMLAGSIAAAKLISTDITQLGTIATGVWQGTALAKAYQYALTAYYDDAAPSFTNLTSFPGGIKVGAGIANDTSTGTTNNRLAKMSGANLVIAGTSDTNVPVWIVTSGAGTTGNAYVALAGQADLDIDGATTAGDYIVASVTTAGKGHDAGATRPAGSFVIGQVTTTNGAAGQYTVTLSHAPGYAFTQISGSLACAQLPALTGDITSSSCVTTIGASKVTNSMLAGSIAAAKLISTDITQLGTIGTGVWQGTAIAIGYGGTGAATAAAGFDALSPVTTRGDIIYRSATTNARLAIGGANTVLHGGTDPNYAAIAGADMTNNTVTSTQMAVVNTRRTCSIIVGADNGSALVDADLGLQGRQCFIPAAATIVEVTVAADAGTPSIQIRKNVAGTTTNLLSAALATATAGAVACAMSSTSQACIDGTTSSGSITVSTTSLAAGSWIELTSGTAGGTAKRMSIAVTYTIN